MGQVTDEEMKARRQAWFNMAYAGLRSQGFTHSWRPNTTACAYRGEGGRRCAVGWLIPDEEYNPLMEGSSCMWLLDGPFCPRSLRGIDGSDAAFLSLLQKAHDAYIEEAIQERLHRIAEDYGLTVPE
jgi:hypothetical protein